MSIKESLTKLHTSPSTLTAIAATTTVLAAIAAKRNKSVLATYLVVMSTTLQAREVYLRHQAGGAMIQKILLSSNAIKDMDFAGKERETNES